MKQILFACVMMAGPALAQDCPDAPDHTQRLAEVIEALQASTSQAQAQQISQELWELWADAPDARAQRLLDMGMQQRSNQDFIGSISTLDELVAYCPDYAEGYNQRAFSSYLRQDYASALVDLDRALDITPNHVAALAGKGLTLIGLGQVEEAQDVLKAAVALNPWLSERRFIREPDGTDI